MTKRDFMLEVAEWSPYALVSVAFVWAPMWLLLPACCVTGGFMLANTFWTGDAS